MFQQLFMPGVAVAAGLLALIFPRVVHIIVGVYLIGVGAIGLWPYFVH